MIVAAFLLIVIIRIKQIIASAVKAQDHVRGRPMGYTWQSFLALAITLL
jgi:hypothetical protein